MKQFFHYWAHLILTIILFPFVSYFTGYFFTYLLNHFSRYEIYQKDVFIVQISLFVTIIILVMFHGLNESFQAIKKDLTTTYGSLENFQKDSKKDWKQFFIGLPVGMLLTFFIWYIS